MSRLTLQHFAAASLADELTIAYLHFASHGHDGGAAFDFQSFKTIIVVVYVLRFRETTPR